MQPLQCDLQPQLQETHRTTPQEQPLVAKHIEGTNRVRNDRSRTRRTHEVPFIVACSHFTRKNTRFRAPASSPKHSPCKIHAAITMRSATTLHQGQVSIAHQPSRSSLNRTPPFKIKSQSHTTLQGQLSIVHHPSRSSLNRTPPFKIKSQSHTTLQGQVSIAHHPSRPSLNRTPPFTPPFKVKSIAHHPFSIAHHPSRSSLNRTPPFKVNSQSRTTLQGQVSIAHHPSRSSLNRTPPFKVKSQSRTTLQGQVSIAHHPSHHPSRSSVNRAPPFLNRAPPFKVKSQSHTTLQGQVSIAHHPSSFQDSEFYLSVPRKYCFPTSFDDGLLIRTLFHRRAQCFVDMILFDPTSPSVKSYQLVEVVSGGRAPGKSSSLASPQLLVIGRFHCFGAVRLAKVQFLYCVDF